MLNDFYKQFKSGTDIRGVASEGVEGQSVNLTDDVVADMADGFVHWLSKKVSKKPSELKISVGRDSRISGPHIMKITTERFKRCGAEVLCCQLASTPSMFMTTVDLGCDGALQITASHHPFNRNGLKFFTREGGLEGSDIEEILLYAQNGEHPEESNGGNITDVDYMSDYAKGLCEKIKKEVNAEDYEHPLKGFKIVVDPSVNYYGYFDARSRSITMKQIDDSVYHELGHFLAFIAGNVDKTASFQSIFAAEKANVTAFNKAYVTQNASEYFAESVKDYILNNASLKSTRPQTYAAVQNALNQITDAQIAKIQKIYGAFWN